MKCFYHPQRDATAQCTDCGKYLCAECASHFDVPLCYDCSMNRTAEYKKTAFKNLGAVIVAFIIGIVIAILESNGSDIITWLISGWIVGLGIAGIPTGWRALDKITPKIFLILPIIGWVIYFAVKGALSIVVGIFLLPFRTVKGLIQYTKAKKTEKYISDSFSN